MEQLIYNKYKYNPEVDFLGQGAFADIYRAYDVLLQRFVALKFYRPTDKQQTESKYDVLNEMRRMIQLQIAHPNLITYYDALLLPVTDSLGRSFPVQIGVVEYANGKEYLQTGADLKAFVARAHPAEQVLKKIAGDILNGLLYLEQRQIVHRDLKPGNILMHRLPNGEWTAKIADFGLVKNLQSSDESTVNLKGTIEYMAPEQFYPNKYGINGRISTNADLWAFGAMLYEIFTGSLPYGKRSQGSSDAEIVAQADNFNANQLPLNAIPQPFAQMIARCLVKHAAQRAQSAAELLDIMQKNIVNSVSDTEKTQTSINPPPPPPKEKNLPPPSQKQPEKKAPQQTPPPTKIEQPAQKEKTNISNTIYKVVVGTALVLLAFWILQQIFGDPLSGLFGNKSHTSANADTLTAVMLNPPLVTLGEITSGKTAQQTVYLKNMGEKPLNITQLQTFCSCLTADWQPKTSVMPNDSTAVTFALNTKGINGAYTDSLLLYANTLANPTRLLISAYVKQPFIPNRDDFEGIKTKLNEVLSFYHQHRSDTLYFSDMFTDPLKYYYSETGYQPLQLIKSRVALQNNGKPSAETLLSNSLSYVILDGNFLADYSVNSGSGASGWFGFSGKTTTRMEAQITYPDFKIIGIREIK
ncbi:DUF1573 domain-containing protein [Sphingobacteriales bacterium UPWRP_1]|nr:hypothetical protein B6N25_01465 [Sphingobacteriales bacterium TSM_CSS]PSJ74963.1 DUF1573 domain-containing protein [Sphingobacteriales bacterium UPWRP_1]